MTSQHHHQTYQTQHSYLVELSRRKSVEREHILVYSLHDRNASPNAFIPRWKVTQTQCLKISFFLFLSSSLPFFLFFLEHKEGHLTGSQTSSSCQKMATVKPAVGLSPQGRLQTAATRECAEGWLDNASVFQSAAYAHTPRTQLYIYIYV